MTTQITTEFNGLWTKKLATDRLVAGKGALQGAYNMIVEVNAQVQALVNQGTFTGVPAEVLNALNAAWVALKTCQTAMSDPVIQEALTWTGTPSS